MEIIYIVGISNSEFNKRIYDEYLNKAYAGEIVGFFDGLSINKNELNQKIKDTYDLNESNDHLVFGHEDPIINLLCDILLNIGYNRNFEAQEYLEKANLQALYNILIVKDLDSAWHTLNINSNLTYARINDIIKEFKTPKGVISEIYLNNKELLSDSDWIEIYRALFKQLMEYCTKDTRRPLENIKVQTYLNSSNNFEFDYINNQIQTSWRNKFIVKNIIETLRKNDFKQDVHVVIKTSQTEEIQKLLEQEGYTCVLFNFDQKETKE